MVPFILPSVIVIAEQAIDMEFAKLILPGLIPIFKIEEPVQVCIFKSLFIMGTFKWIYELFSHHELILDK